MHLLRIQEHMIEERLPGHEVIAFRMIGRHGPLIYPEELEVFPGHALDTSLARLGEQLEGCLGCGTAADGDARPAIRFGGFGNHLHEVASSAASQGGGIGLDEVLDRQLTANGHAFLSTLSYTPAFRGLSINRAR